MFGSIASGFQKYSVTIFFVVLTGGLAAAVLILNSTLSEASDTSGYTSSLDATTFDQTTIDRVKQLHTSSEPVPAATVPAGRTNPFSE
jgi:hypothetical protein